ncbi:hypothetical protein E2C01_051406 [Portunus trituberculatus]|uniref:Uncharacterized protein n=1 Tax=Portunus trituberculatus TaxID=210409 RepID=A0A5B7GJH3_PORTR|nr:hypothetical protein [Portunus trituberculatus]
MSVCWRFRYKSQTVFIKVAGDNLATHIDWNIKVRPQYSLHVVKSDSKGLSAGSGKLHFCNMSFL